MPLSAAIGAGRNPRFGGGRYRLPLIFLYRHYGSRIVGANHGKQKTLRNVVVFHPHSFLCHTPPFVPVAKSMRPPGHEKHPGFGPSNRLRKPGGPVRRIVVNRDPFRKLRFGKCQEFLVPIRRPESSLRTGPKFPVSLVDCLLNRPHLLLHRQPLDHLPRLRRRPKL